MPFAFGIGHLCLRCPFLFSTFRIGSIDESLLTRNLSAKGVFPLCTAECDQELHPLFGIEVSTEQI